MMKNVKDIVFGQKDKVLPDTYQEVEYIESTGTQYINTGLVPSHLDIIDMKFSPTSVSVNSSYFGVRESGTYNTGNYNQIYINYNPQVHTNIWFFVTTTGTLAYPNVKLSQMNPQVNGIYKLRADLSELGVPQANRTHSYYLFAFNNAGTANTYGPSRIYYLKIKDRGDFVPCYRKSDNKPGMYDLVTNQFFTNQGSGEFTIGPTPKSRVLSVKDNDDNLLWHKALPDGYDELSYLESNGTQYIDTGYIPQSETRVMVEYIPKTFIALANNAVLGGRINAGSNNFSIMHEKGSGTSIFNTLFFGAGTKTQDTGYNIQFNKPMRITYQKDSSVYRQNGAKGISSGHGGITDGVSVYLFSCNQDGNADFKSFIKMFYVEIYEGDEPQMKLIPALRKSDSKPGMYDIVNDIFYTNQGTGEFVYKVK